MSRSRVLVLDCVHPCNGVSPEVSTRERRRGVGALRVKHSTGMSPPPIRPVTLTGTSVDGFKGYPADICLPHHLLVAPNVLANGASDRACWRRRRFNKPGVRGAHAVTDSELPSVHRSYGKAIGSVQPSVPAAAGASSKWLTVAT